MNPYSNAYSVGYYYGRALGYVRSGNDLSPHDEAYVETQGFKDGFAAGKRDFEEIDLPKEAISHTQEDNS